MTLMSLELLLPRRDGSVSASRPVSDLATSAWSTGSMPPVTWNPSAPGCADTVVAPTRTSRPSAHAPASTRCLMTPPLGAVGKEPHTEGHVPACLIGAVGRFADCGEVRVVQSG